jgi:hypothetical protein
VALSSSQYDGEQFSVTHDDGASLYINGETVLSDVVPSWPVTTTGTYSGPGGTYDLSLVNSEVEGPPAVLQFELPAGLAPVPEPTTIFAGALMLLPFGSSAVRQLRKKMQGA